MSNELSTTTSDTPDVQLPAVSQAGLNALTEMSQSSRGYVGRVQLFTKGKAINKGLVMPGEYGIAESEDKIIRLGRTMDVVPLAFRAKALDISDTDDIKTSYDINSDEYKRIKNLADTTENSGCMHGISFLLYERTSKRFLEWFCNNDSARREAGNVGPFLPQESNPTGSAMTVGSRVAEKKTYSWHVPTINECSTPIQLPDAARVRAEIERFLNPPKPEAESVSDEEKQNVKRRAR